MDPYIDLCVAIIERAIEDYRNALIGNNTRQCVLIEHFLRSEWGMFLMGRLDPNYIIESVRKEVANG
jgi:hypothetical protein